MKRLIFMVLICLVAVKGYAVEEAAHYYLDDALADTVVIDQLGTNGTLAGGETSAGVSVTGKIKTAFHFDGNDYVDTNQEFDATDSPVYSAPFSVSTWIKPDDGHPGATDRPCGAIKSTAEDYFQMTINTTGTVAFAYKTNNGAAIAATTDAEVWADGATSWTHVVCVAEQITGVNTRMLIYIDGTLTKTGTAGAGVMADFETDRNTYIGARQEAGGGAGGFFAGDFDDFRMIGKALSAGEVSAIYEGGRGNQGGLNHPAPSIGISCGATVGSS